PYFHHLQTKLFGRPVMISRTGYTGERGYEIFCKAADAPTIWDGILEQGVPLEVRGSLSAKAIAHSLPFDDPEKKKRTAKG
ncbi:MAG: hypothetical protein CVV17_02840, partial [Gammaproteobacteria bacterium HGW-Gammaproteobacteria-7]